MDSQNNIAELISARICHDLISPIGALGNGIELLELSSGTASPEMMLLRESVTLVNARLRLFRLAFGQVSPDDLTSTADFAALLSQVGTNTRISHRLNAPEMVPCGHVQTVALILMCLETALPFGADIHINATLHQHDGSPHLMWQIHAQSDRIQWVPERWQEVTTGTAPDVTAREVQFILLPKALSRLRRTLHIERGADWVTLEF